MMSSGGVDIIWTEEHLYFTAYGGGIWIYSMCAPNLKPQEASWKSVKSIFKFMVELSKSLT